MSKKPGQTQTDGWIDVIKSQNLTPTVDPCADLQQQVERLEQERDEILEALPDNATCRYPEITGESLLDNIRDLVRDKKKAEDEQNKQCIRAQAAEAQLATLAEVRDEQWDEIKGALARNNIPIEGSVAATVNLLTDRFRECGAAVHERDCTIAALREGLEWAKAIFDSGDVTPSHDLDEVVNKVNYLLSSPNPGARVAAVVDEGRVLKERWERMGCRVHDQEQWNRWLSEFIEAVRALDKREGK